MAPISFPEYSRPKKPVGKLDIWALPNEVDDFFTHTQVGFHEFSL